MLIGAHLARSLQVLLVRAGWWDLREQSKINLGIIPMGTTDLTCKKGSLRFFFCAKYAWHNIWNTTSLWSRVSSVGTATRYGLDGPGIESRWGERFSASVQTGSEAHPASYTMATGSFLGVKRPGRGVDHPHPSSAEFAGCCSILQTGHITLSSTPDQQLENHST